MHFNCSWFFSDDRMTEKLYFIGYIYIFWEILFLCILFPSSIK